MFQTRFTIFAVLILLMAAAILVSNGRQNVTAGTLLAHLDPDCPGCGGDYFSEASQGHPMAYALLASSGAELRDSALVKLSADWLVEHATENGTTFGWGLGFEWDAFADGSVNPPDTIYGITQAWAVTGLLDAYEMTLNEEYLTAVTKALNYYAQFYEPDEAGGFFWYSNQSADATSVYNVTAMLAGAFARASTIAEIDEYWELSLTACRSLLKSALETDDFRYWNYASNRARPNDLVHAAYVMQGLELCARHADLDYDSTNDLRYLATFLDNGIVREYSAAHELSSGRAMRQARLWGVGMAIYTATDLGDPKLGATFANLLRNYQVENGFLNDPTRENINEPRMLAHATLGLARLGRH